MKSIFGTKKKYFYDKKNKNKIWPLSRAIDHSVREGEIIGGNKSVK
jgi:aspartyl/asparaginyl-tRNA synthetase